MWPDRVRVRCPTDCATRPGEFASRADRYRGEKNIHVVNGKYWPVCFDVSCGLVFVFSACLISPVVRGNFFLSFQNNPNLRRRI